MYLLAGRNNSDKSILFFIRYVIDDGTLRYSVLKKIQYGLVFLHSFNANIVYDICITMHNTIVLCIIVTGNKGMEISSLGTI